MAGLTADLQTVKYARFNIHRYGRNKSAYAQGLWRKSQETAKGKGFHARGARGTRRRRLQIYQRNRAGAEKSIVHCALKNLPGAWRIPGRNPLAQRLPGY